MAAHYTDSKSFTNAFLEFSHLARENKLKIGIQENQESLIIATLGLWEDYDLFKHGLSAIFCSSQEDIEIFEKIFNLFWSEKMMGVKSKTTLKNQSNIVKPSNASLVMMGEGEDDNDTDKKDAKNISGASQSENLRKTDFSKVSAIDSERLEQLADMLFRQMSLRLKRNYKQGKKGMINIQSTIRNNIDKGGNLIELIRKQKKIKKYRLVILLDVSGSMDKYSFYLLRFIFALRSNFEHIEAFVFSTMMLRITEYLDRSNLEEALSILTYNAKHWSGGTKIGECLKQFNENHAKRILNGKTLTILLSDGLDTGEPMILKNQLHQIKLRSKKLIWMNPLKGMKDYQPIQRGMKVALPELDVFQSAHNIESLLELEKILEHA